MKARKLPILLFFFALQAYSQEQLTNSEKLYGLSLFWQEVNYNFAYFDQVEDLDWDAEYIKTIQQVNDSKSNFEYYRIMQQLAAKLNDGHTEVYFPDEINTQLITPNIEVFEENGRYVITNISPLLKRNLPIGSTLLAVNQKPTRTYLLEEIHPNISSSTDAARESMALRKMFTNFEDSTYVLLIKTPEGKKETVRLKLKPTHSAAWVNKSYKNHEFGFQKMGSIAYLNLPSFENTDVVHEFRKLLPKINQSEGLVIDIRQNVGGQAIVALNIAQHLLQEDEIIDMPWKSRQHIASLKAWGNSGLQLVGYKSVEEYQDFGDLDAWLTVESDTLSLDPKREKVNVPVVILMSENTASAAENFLIFALQNKTITTMGTASFGSTGQPIYFSLPGNAIARVCAKKNFDIDGSEFVGKGIQPKVCQPLLLENEIKQYDAQLAVAIEALEKE